MVKRFCMYKISLFTRDFQNKGIGTALLSKLLENYPEVRQKSY